MYMKVCSKCKVEKELTDFYPIKKGSARLRCYCIECDKKIIKEYRITNAEKIKEYKINYNKNISEDTKQKNKERKKIYKEKNKDILKVKNKEYYFKNKDIISKKQKDYRVNNSEEIYKKAKEWYKNNKEIVSKKSKEYRLKNAEEVKERKKDYYEKNKDIISKKQKDYKSNNKDKRNKNERERRANDNLFKITSSIRTLISMSIRNKGYTKKSKTYEILGCTFEEFKLHIESQFTEGMSWDNRNKWHLDHIIPISSAKTEEEVIKLNHYTNFQPLWAIDNLRKGNKINN
jgi:hypothetical protein